MTSHRKIAVSVTMGTTMHQDLQKLGNVSENVRKAVDEYLKKQTDKK